MPPMPRGSASRAAQTWRSGALLAVLLFATTSAAEEFPATRQIGGKLLTLHNGRVLLHGEAAEIDVPPGMVFLAGGDARFVVELMWRNPFDIRIIGLIVPADADFARNPAAPPPEQARDMRLDPEAMPTMPQAQSRDSAADAQWATVIAWTEGHVHERMVRDLDPDRILADMREAMPRANAAPSGAAVPHADLLGWAVPPHYDGATHALTWAKRICFYYGDASGPRRLEVATQINHCAYLLGARGVLEFTTIADDSDLTRATQTSSSILARTTIRTGHRYADFRSGSDPEYAGDLGARIAGGEDPGNLQLAVKSRYALWTTVACILAVLVGLVLSGVFRRGRLLSVPLATGTSAPAPGSGLCPRCGQAIHAEVARCPACGASTIARTDRHA